MPRAPQSTRPTPEKNGQARQAILRLRGSFALLEGAEDAQLAVVEALGEQLHDRLEGGVAGLGEGGGHLLRLVGRPKALDLQVLAAFDRLGQVVPDRARG